VSADPDRGGSEDAASTRAAYEATAVACAATRARSYLLMPSVFRRSIVGVDVTTERYARALSTIEHRAVDLQTTPAVGARKAQRSAAPDMDVDPWSVEPDALPETSRVTCACPTCSGAKRVTCSVCDGTQRVTCAGCGGTGRVMGKRGTKNCPTCRGNGDRKCQECRSGLVACADCDESGSVEAWLVVRQVRREVVTTSGSVAARAVHSRIDRPDDFEARDTFQSVLVHDERLAAGALPAELTPDLDPPADRLVGARVQVFEGLAARVSIRLALGTASFHIAGLRPVCRQVEGGALSRRLALGVATAAMAAAASVALVSAFVSRHAWFATDGPWPALATALAIGTLTAGALSLVLAEGRATWTPLRILIPLAATMLTSVTAATIYFGARPSVAHAASLADSGDLDRAVTEADAARSLTPDRVAAEAVLDRVHRTRMERAQSTADTVHWALEPWFDPTREAEAHAYADREHLDRLRAARDIDDVEPLASIRWFDATNATEGDAIIHSAFDRAISVDSATGEGAALRALRPRVAALAPDLVPRIDRQLALFAIESCRVSHDWSCVAARIADARAAGAPEETWLAARDEAAATVRAAGRTALSAATAAGGAQARATHLHEALDDAQLLTSLHVVDPALDPVALAARVATADASAQQEAERRQHEADATAERRQRAAKRETREREAERPRCSACTCCDGSCGCCGQGCCSHHHGICG